MEVNMIIDAYLADKGLMASSAATARDYLCRAMRQMAITDIEDITAHTLAAWQADRQTALSPATYNITVIYLRDLLNWAGKMGLCTDGSSLAGILHTVSAARVRKAAVQDALGGDPHGIHTPAEIESARLAAHGGSEDKRRPYTADECRALLQSTQGYNQVRDRAILAVLIYTGCRGVEISGLSLAHARQIRDEGRLSIVRKGLRVQTIEINAPAIWEFLGPYVQQRMDKAGYTAMTPVQQDAFWAQPLFVTTHNHPMTTRSIFAALRLKQAAAGVPTGVHNTRRTTANAIESVTADPSIVRDILGHCSVATTSRYLSSSAADRADVMQKITY